MALAGLGAAAIAADVLWSDPVADPGLELNEQRGVGTVFGPDITEVGSTHTSNCCHVCYFEADTDARASEQRKLAEQ